MAELTLTRKSIQDDIEAFTERIQSAKQRLLALPSSVAGWQKRKKLKATRNGLTTEIDHVKRIRQYAMDSLAEFAEG